ncbi:hypothetical protein FHL15_003944 [Xylaria flabelliformis]|uniref:Uncharacterized protein n=1 Tax=Xylaria flabelliformis TaxID=2512241 RepID=A0A553I4Y1_9PEZI|nr:hypothetical protein FHL15_003944 [Xylaria flabelliformis]
MHSTRIEPHQNTLGNAYAARRSSGLSICGLALLGTWCVVLNALNLNHISGFEVLRSRGPPMYTSVPT